MLDDNDEFRSLLAALADCEDDSARQHGEARIWARYGTSGAAFISDMCRFSRTTRSHGICHFLGLIERARRIIAPEILRHGGRLLKFEIDNSFAFFPDVDSALLCARDLTARVEESNARVRAEDQISIAIGIDHGDLLLIDDRDFFGDPVNTACKLGEDVAESGEVLLTAAARERLDPAFPHGLREQLVSVSGLEVRVFAVEAAR